MNEYNHVQGVLIYIFSECRGVSSNTLNLDKLETWAESNIQIGRFHTWPPTNMC